MSIQPLLLTQRPTPKPVRPGKTEPEESPQTGDVAMDETVRLDAAAAGRCNVRRSGGYALGLLFILFVALLWSGSSVLVQYIYSDLTFDSPFFVTYISNVLFSLYLPGWPPHRTSG